MESYIKKSLKRLREEIHDGVSDANIGRENNKKKQKRVKNEKSTPYDCELDRSWLSSSLKDVRDVKDLLISIDPGKINCAFTLYDTRRDVSLFGKKISFVKKPQENGNKVPVGTLINRVKHYLINDPHGIFGLGTMIYPERQGRMGSGFSLKFNEGNTAINYSLYYEFGDRVKEVSASAVKKMFPEIFKRESDKSKQYRSNKVNAKSSLDMVDHNIADTVYIAKYATAKFHNNNNNNVNGGDNKPKKTHYIVID